MKLIQTFTQPIHGFWDGGPRSRFEWTIRGPAQKDSKGEYVRIGSWDANHWFHVSVGKTERNTLDNARRRLQVRCKRHKAQVVFNYEN